MRDPEVQDLHDRLPVLRNEEDVLGLQVAVHDAECVCSNEPARHLCNDGIGIVRAQFSQTIELCAEIFAFEKFHHDEGHAIPDPVLEYLDDVHAADLSRRPCFARKTREDLAVPELVGIEELERANAVQGLIVRQPYASHPTGTYLPGQDVALRYQ